MATTAAPLFAPLISPPEGRRTRSDHIRRGRRLGRRGADFRSGGGVIGVGKARRPSGPRLHGDFRAEPDEFLDGLRRRGDAGFGFIGFGEDSDAH